MSIQTNNAVVVEAINGSREAWGKLFVEFKSYVYSLAKAKTRDADEAEEIVSEVFLKGFTKIKTLRAPQAFPGWLRRIVSRCVVNLKTRNLLQTNIEDNLDTVQAGPECSDDSPDNATVRNAVSRIGEGYTDPRAVAVVGSLKEIVDRHYFRGQDVASISSDLGLPVGTIKRRLHDARAELKRILVAA